MIADEHKAKWLMEVASVAEILYDLGLAEILQEFADRTKRLQ
jgi:hypothetical protein